MLSGVRYNRAVFGFLLISRRVFEHVADISARKTKYGRQLKYYNVFAGPFERQSKHEVFRLFCRNNAILQFR